MKPVGLAMVVFGILPILFRGPFSRLDMRLHDWIHRRIPAVYAIPGMRHRLDARLQVSTTVKGKMTARYADRDEVFEVGDAFYTPLGHIPVKNEPGTEILWFSPREELRTAEAVMMKNMQAMQDRSTP